MRRFLNQLRSIPRPKHVSSPPRRACRPQLEQLGERLVPSASSAISIYHPLGWLSYTERDWFTVDQSTTQVVEFQGTTRRNLGGPTHVSAVSASVDPNTGYGEVFALAPVTGPFGFTYTTVWRCDSAGNWLSFPLDFGLLSYTALSATHDGHVFAGNGSNVEYLDSNGNAVNLGAPSGGLAGTGTSLAASVGWLGGNEVFVISGNGVIYVDNINFPGQWRLVDNTQSFVALSATQNDTVFAVTSAGKLYQEIEHIYWSGHTGYFYWTNQDLSGGKQFTGTLSADLDAAGHDEVYAVDTATGLYLYDQGSWALKDISVADVAAADGGFFYDVDYTFGYLYASEYNPQTHSWTFLGWNLT
jgi:hypothetical protein